MTKRFGAYEILHELSQGGMGSVLLARRKGPGSFEQLVAAFHAARGVDPGPIDGDNLARLERHAWPGNVRELRNVLERAWALSGPNASFRDLRLWLDPQAAQGQLSEVVDTGLPFKEAKERWNDQFERRYVASVFGAAGQNVTRAAEHAGLSRRHFRELLYKHGIIERPAAGAAEEE